ncbi:MAG: hypothetical protein FWF59_05915, partial [Turicibacter sp.]|nr:hypothetical protein [Turicibacter sp.]
PDRGFLRYINFDTAIIPWEPGRVKAVLLFDAYVVLSNFVHDVYKIQILGIELTKYSHIKWSEENASLQ